VIERPDRSGTVPRQSLETIGPGVLDLSAGYRSLLGDEPAADTREALLQRADRHGSAAIADRLAYGFAVGPRIAEPRSALTTEAAADPSSYGRNRQVEEERDFPRGSFRAGDHGTDELRGPLATRGGLAVLLDGAGDGDIRLGRCATVGLGNQRRFSRLLARLGFGLELSRRA